MFRVPSVLNLVLLLGCTSSTASTDVAPVQVGVIRTVDAERLEDPDEWGPVLDLALETEFWDLIGNSAHEQYGDWHEKAKAYVAANSGADPRLAMLISAGAVFSLTTLFQHSDPLSQIGEYADYIDDATVGIGDAVEPLGDHEPAVVFFHNNQAMLAFLLGSNPSLGICHLEKLRNLEDSNAAFHGTEGRAAAPFTYGMVHDEAYVDYAIELMEGCDNWICNWTSKLAPFKPIGQLTTLAELHAIKAALTIDESAQADAYEEMNALLDRAAMLGAARGYPFIDRIEELRTELPAREYETGIGLGRSPMPVYSNESNCGGCHIGGIPGRFGEELDDPYPAADLWTAKPGPPPFKGDASATCD
ncbi:MAG: hypothetical protein ACN4G0_18620 [Polyangiales bacterium]